MAHIFLTGATGFIGSFVARILVESQHEVTCLVRENSNLSWIKELDLKLVTGTLQDPATFESHLKDVEYIIHLAGVTKSHDPELFYLGNVQVTHKLLSCITERKISLKKFIFVSSQAAVGPSPSAEPVDEKHPCYPLTQYGKSKWQAEQVVQNFQSHIPVTIVRPTAVYGPRDTDVYNFFKLMTYGINLMVGKVDQLVNVVYVEDCANGIIKAAFSEKTVGKTYFICEEEAYYWSQFAQITADILQKKYITIKLPVPLVNMVALFLEKWARFRGQDTILNRDKMQEVGEPFWRVTCIQARKDFNYQTQFPAPLGIEKTLGWYQENNWL
ncbi:MAG: NAD(P)-dependent oxidoreductase [bacterium]|nr:MAG: NAD(P)-dependent oxidoreductase [bacterium]